MNGCPPLAPDRRQTGSAASFGNGSYLRIEDDGSFFAADGFTVSAWVNVRQPSKVFDRSCAVCKPLDGTFTNSWSIVVENDGRPLFYSGLSSDEEDFLFGEGELSLARWTHMAITWDGNAKQLWVDGAAVATRQADIEFAVDPVIIGGDLDQDQFVVGFDGRVDDVRLHDRPLAAGEIARLAEVDAGP